jgi:excisionase family DNA binding protein
MCKQLPSGAPLSGFLTVAEAATFLGISTKSIRRAISSGEIQAFRLPGGALIRIPVGALTDALKPIPTVGKRGTGR